MVMRSWPYAAENVTRSSRQSGFASSTDSTFAASSALSYEYSRRYASKTASATGFSVE